MSGDLVPIANSMVVIGVLSAVIAALYAVFERDDGRALGWSSVSQLGLAILLFCLYAMQHGICKALLFSTLNPETPTSLSHHPTDEHGDHLNDKRVVSRFQNYSTLIIYIIASLSVMAFPLTSGFVTKNLLKGDIPMNAKIIVSTSTLLTTTVYVRLIWSRIQTFLRYRPDSTNAGMPWSWNINQFFLIGCSVALVLFGLSDYSVMTTTILPMHCQQLVLELFYMPQ